MKIKNATAKGYEEAYEGDSINLSRPDSKTRRGRVGKQIANTLDTGGGNTMGVLKYGRIRKLTPTECFRLQGVDEDIIQKLVHSGISDTQLYRAAGDSVCVPIVEAIARKMISIWKEEQDAVQETNEEVHRDNEVAEGI